ncbi:hypothetical protein JDV02_008805 [Purpureocillium takamizusanense]|uniref:Uncharacterized protein n=1 Tax=Purpureocillium takamizusanense TaxID=2060973 RepID=A0A9Q8QPG0_9HYPO|nr:uncharacterized protein JDV02_008805 [Purpureocillium takamizusanense]UNI22962.1 hypothetical protein JDV02_008805 [Purpureocillium takamizusanense]
MPFAAAVLLPWVVVVLGLGGSSSSSGPSLGAALIIPSGSSDENPAKPVITPPPAFPLNPRGEYSALSSTCGYLNGDPRKPRFAPSGSACNWSSTYWGFCATSDLDKCTIYATCIDSYGCSGGCPGPTKTKDNTAITCPSGQYCSTALLSYNVQQTNAIGSYTFVTCGVEAATAHYIVSPTMLLVDTSAIPTNSNAPTQGQQGTATNKGASPEGGGAATSSAQPSAIASGGGQQQSTSVGAIAGGVVGALAVLCGVALAVFFIVRRQRRKVEEEKKNRMKAQGALGGGGGGDVEGPIPVDDDQMDDKTHIVAIGYKAGHDDSPFGADADARSELPGDVMSRDSPGPGDIRSMCFSMPPSRTDSVTLPPWAASELPVQYSRMSHRAEMPG